MNFPFLPKNPNCSGCNSSPSLGCNDPCKQFIGNTDMIVYSGPNLDAIDVKNCDTLTVVLQKINQAIQGGVIPSTTTTTSTTQIPTGGINGGIPGSPYNGLSVDGENPGDAYTETFDGGNPGDPYNL